MKSLYEAEGRKAWVDLGKGISILLVVLFHCEEYLPIVDTGTAGPFSFFRMPFFFFLSGYIFVSDYTQFSLRRKLKQILRGIVWTYLIFALILVVPKSLSNGYPVADGLKMIFLGWASWFVVSLGMAQLFFALFLWRCKKQKGILMFMAGCLLAGILIKCCSESVLPFQLDKAFFVVLFFGAGFFYRIYEAVVERFVGKKYFALSIVVFLCLMLFEYRYMHGSTSNVFWGNGIQNFPLFVCYTMAGIWMMLQLVKNLDATRLKTICYIGANSLVFYYLNGGAVKFWRLLYYKVNNEFLLQHRWLSFLIVFFLVSATLFAVVVAIKKYCPILVGDKKAFNRCFPKYNW